jgi:ABC-type proline/glycine betaine transport system permease subunit
MDFIHNFSNAFVNAIVIHPWILFVAVCAALISGFLIGIASRYAWAFQYGRLFTFNKSARKIPRRMREIKARRAAQSQS